ncbi:MAG: aminotransferase class III-fold pyridoxal phosphate-dependent enzyme, partial [Novosphingobium sp.]|nr:aminotransferase class III-fold pyridoxal phosphate-dependent enzyme [Novosphingobium sp.]
MTEIVHIALAIAGVIGALAFARMAIARLRLSLAKHPSLAGHVRLARRLARLTPAYEFGWHEFFRADDPPEDIARRRQAAFRRLASLYRERFAQTAASTAQAGQALSDLRFTGAYRVPFPFSRIVRENLSAGSFLERSKGVLLYDLDGNPMFDLTGSYGVNLLGTDRYKQLIAQGAETVAELGPVLGGLHRVVAENVRRLRAISGLDEVSFHMSGTEAVMQAVRLARYHT